MPMFRVYYAKAPTFVNHPTASGGACRTNPQAPVDQPKPARATLVENGSNPCPAWRDRASTPERPLNSGP
jgi:hypothetical protein